MAKNLNKKKVKTLRRRAKKLNIKLSTKGKPKTKSALIRAIRRKERR